MEGISATSIPLPTKGDCMSTKSPAELMTAWEDAYLSQCHTARVGRLFKGTIHNLNGVIQAFSMQAELFALMFVKADRLLGEALEAGADEAGRDRIIQVRELLQKRQKNLEQVEEKILLSQEMLRNNEDLSQMTGDGCSVSLNGLLDNVLSFFHSHMFFKHKVRKDVRRDVEVCLGARSSAVAFALATLVENSIEALLLNTGHEACFGLRSLGRDGSIVIEVEDNGVGVPESLRQSLFQEFVTDKEGHAGVGLYQARKLLAGIGGQLVLSSPADPTLFTITLPTQAEKV